MVNRSCERPTFHEGGKWVVFLSEVGHSVDLGRPLGEGGVRKDLFCTIRE
ncbi:hypothetical protein HMPREF0043_01540 [Actinobaculum sp. oral taxon 183 str. F0552]|nr:hypothetical protein HMPREF0043_01540 [Actinobaculum sp. oral taxon 183 str. F0552]